METGFKHIVRHMERVLDAAGLHNHTKSGSTLTGSCVYDIQPLKDELNSLRKEKEELQR